MPGRERAWREPAGERRAGTKGRLSMSNANRRLLVLAAASAAAARRAAGRPRGGAGLRRRHRSRDRGQRPRTRGRRLHDERHVRQGDGQGRAGRDPGGSGASASIGNVQGEGAADVVLRESRPSAAACRSSRAARRRRPARASPATSSTTSRAGRCGSADNVVNGSVQVVANRGGVTIADEHDRRQPPVQGERAAAGRAEATWCTATPRTSARRSRGVRRAPAPGD